MTTTIIKQKRKILNVNKVKHSDGMVVEKELNCSKSFKGGKGWLTAGTEGGV